LGNRVQAFPFSFENPKNLADSLRGATTLYNTYWVRFNQGKNTFERAVENTLKLIQAAEKAGVDRFVQVSITNADPDSPLPYFRGKGILEGALQDSNLSFAIIRPTVVFGKEDILINNIGWLLRRFPVFGIPGSGSYQLQPVYVDDLAEIMIRAGEESENLVLDGVGPDVLTFEEMVRLIKASVGSRAKIIHTNPRLALWISKAIGWEVKDVVLTLDELEGLTEGLLVSTKAPTGRTRLCDWLGENGQTLGMHYSSELRRHYSRP